MLALINVFRSMVPITNEDLIAQKFVKTFLFNVR